MDSSTGQCPMGNRVDCREKEVIFEIRMLEQLMYR